MIAPGLREHVPVAERDSALAVGAAIFGPTVGVGGPPSGGRAGAPPVGICANRAVVHFVPNLRIVVGLRVLDGSQRASSRKRTNERDVDCRA